MKTHDKNCTVLNMKIITIFISFYVLLVLIQTTDNKIMHSNFTVKNIHENSYKKKKILSNFSLFYISTPYTLLFSQHNMKSNTSIKFLQLPHTTETSLQTSTEKKRNQTFSNRTNYIKIPETSKIFHEKNENKVCFYEPIVVNCSIRPIDKYIQAKVKHMVEQQRLNLIEFHINFPFLPYNPLLFINSTLHHRPDIWSRVTTTYGQTLLSLAFNYGILSLMTLTFNTNKTQINLQDFPKGCFLQINEKTQLGLVRDLLMRDFSETDIQISNDEGDEGIEEHRVCTEFLQDEDGYGKFLDCCCFRYRFSGAKKCETSYKNFWLSFLYQILFTLRYLIFLFGPLLFISAMVGLTRDEYPYVVNLKQPLHMIIKFTDQQTTSDEFNLVDLSSKKGYSRLEHKLIEAYNRININFDSKIKEQNLKDDENEEHKKLLQSLEIEDEFNQKRKNNNEYCLLNKELKVKIVQYDLLINYKRLVTENNVSIGFWKTISYNIFFCQLRKISPFNVCCSTKMFTFKGKEIEWIKFWRIIGLVMLVLFLPVPFFVRIIVMKNFELDEIISRKNLIWRAGLLEPYEGSLIHYLLPGHPILIIIYIIYIITSIAFIVYSTKEEENIHKKPIISAFTDLKYLSYIDILHFFFSNFIWPFQKFGLKSFLLAFVYYPVMLPFTLIICILYSLPTCFLVTRFFFYCFKSSKQNIKSNNHDDIYRVSKVSDNSLKYFYVDEIYKAIKNLKTKKSGDLERQGSIKTPVKSQLSRISFQGKFKSTKELSYRPEFSFQYKNVLLFLVYVIVLISIMIIVTECLGWFFDMMIFTLMGIIVNAGSLLKYIALIIMILVYSYDSFNNVEKRYLKLNKSLFSEIKSRIKDFEKVTSRPSEHQENSGFKTEELNEQTEFEESDHICNEFLAPRNWLINDLVLFIDNEDRPRIPRELFEKVCAIRVAGVPGPVYRGLINAMKQFMKIVIFIMFVFLVVLTFGSVYQVSNTNQMLAALAGGSLPFILRTFMEPEKPDIDIGTLSFRSKLSEVIKNFKQYWPIYDLPFELYVKEPSRENDDAVRKSSLKLTVVEEKKETRRKGSIFVLNIKDSETEKILTTNKNDNLDFEKIENDGDANNNVSELYLNPLRNSKEDEDEPDFSFKVQVKLPPHIVEAYKKNKPSENLFSTSPKLIGEFIQT